jgi:hypothetical protein
MMGLGRHRTALLPVLAFIIPLLAGGCAKYPPGQGVGSQRRMQVEVYFAEPVNPNYHYFLAIDTDGDPATGPVAVRSKPWGGNGWVLSPLSFFVEYYVAIPGGYGVYQVNPDNILEQTYLGAPLLADRDEAFRLRFTIDLNTIDPTDTLDEIQINIIATDEVPINPNEDIARETDGLGAIGNDYVSISLHEDRTYQNSMMADPERAGDVQNGALDIVDWRIVISLD